MEKNDNGILDLYKEIIVDMKRSSKRNFIIIIVLIILLFASNLAWLIYENQYETVSNYETVQETQFTESSTITQTMN